MIVVFPLHRYNDVCVVIRLESKTMLLKCFLVFNLKKKTPSIFNFKGGKSYFLMDSRAQLVQSLL